MKNPLLKGHAEVLDNKGMKTDMNEGFQHNCLIDWHCVPNDVH